MSSKALPPAEPGSHPHDDEEHSEGTPLPVINGDGEAEGGVEGELAEQDEMDEEELDEEEVEGEGYGQSQALAGLMVIGGEGATFTSWDTSGGGWRC